MHGVLYSNLNVILVLLKLSHKLQHEVFSIILFPVPVSLPHKFCLNKPLVSTEYYHVNDAVSIDAENESHSHCVHFNGCDLLFQEVFTCGEGPPPKEHAVYSDQLEQSWMTDSHFQVQVPRKLHRPKLGEYHTNVYEYK